MKAINTNQTKSANLNNTDINVHSLYDGLQISTVSNSMAKRMVDNGTAYLVTSQDIVMIPDGKVPEIYKTVGLSIDRMVTLHDSNAEVVGYFSAEQIDLLVRLGHARYVTTIDAALI